MSAIRPIAPAVALLIAMGCQKPYTDPLAPTGPPIVWPDPPDPPRVRYLGAITGSPDIDPRKTISQKWNELFYGPESPEMLVTPHAVAVHANGTRVAVADSQAGCVHTFELERRTYRVVTSIGESKERLRAPVAVAWINDDLWIADAREHAIAIVPGEGTPRWIGNDTLERPAGMTWCRDNNLCYVSDSGAHAIVAFDRTGNAVLQFGSRGAEPGQFNYPSHMTSASGMLIVADSLNFRIQVLGVDGSPMTAFGRQGDAAGDLSLPKGVAVDADGNIWVVDAHFENVQAFTPEGQLLLAVGREGSEPGEFWLPAGLCIDAKNRMWVADAGNRRLQVFELLKP